MALFADLSLAADQATAAHRRQLDLLRSQDWLQPGSAAMDAIAGLTATARRLAAVDTELRSHMQQQLDKLARASAALAAVAPTGSAHHLVRRMHLQLRARYGRRCGRLLDTVRNAPMAHADALLATLMGNSTQLQAALDELPADADPAVRAALLLALESCTQLHTLTVRARTENAENVGVSDITLHGRQRPPALVLCRHHRRHLVTSAGSADPDPGHVPGAMSRRTRTYLEATSHPPV